VFSQDSVDFNEYYAFPISAGAEFRSLTPTNAALARDTTMTEISASTRYPLPFFPTVQPLFKLGFMNTTWLASDDFGSRDHTSILAELGAAWAYRFSKNFEAGAALSAGISQSYFPNLTDDDSSVRSDNFVATLAGSVSLNPSYSFSIEVKPAVRYQRALQSGLTNWDFNGLSFGLGFGAHYRFGNDPDEQTLIQSIRFGEAAIDPVFAAMQSWYVDNPIGSIRITNIESFPISGLQLSFFQNDKMDTPTVSAFIEELQPNESTTVDLKAVFNSTIFDTLGELQLTGEVIANYTFRTRRVEQKHPVNFSLLDGSSITWDDDNKAGAFITPADSAVRNYSSYVRQVGRSEVVPGFSSDLQVAMQLYYAMQEQGLIYQVDPNTPFTEMQEQTTFVDSVSVARETLGRGTGDCDDLTVLYNTLLETVGVKTGFITTPGHIYSAFSTGLPPDRYLEIHPDPDMTVEIDGELWVPVEITLVDSGDFLAAWRYGVEDYGAYDEKPELRGFYKTAEAQALYAPVALRQEDAGLQYAPGDQIVTKFRRGMDRIIEAIITEYAFAAEQSGKKREYNQLGIVSAQYGRYANAERAFNTALSLDRNYLSPLINLGNVYLMQNQFRSALRNYHRAEENLMARNRQESPTFQSLLLNISKSYHALENFDRAQEYYEILREINPDMAARNTYLEEGQGRASQAQQGPGILFVDPEEED
jgi:tetratricopeptide (TPR) repeat protein